MSNENQSLNEGQEQEFNAEFVQAMAVIENKDPAKRSVEDDCMLASYYFMLSEGKDRSKIEQALEIFLRHGVTLYESPIWNYHVGICYYYLRQPEAAMRFLSKAKQDEEYGATSAQYLQSCIDILQIPNFAHNFTERSQECYKQLLEQVPSLLKEITEQYQSPNGISKELHKKVMELLNIAFARVSFNLSCTQEPGSQVWDPTITFEPMGNIARALTINYFIEHAPKELTQLIKLRLGLPRDSSFSLNFGKTKLNHDSVKCFVNKRNDDYHVFLHCPQLKNLLKDDFYAAYKMHLDLANSALGEIGALSQRITFDVIYELKAPDDSILGPVPLSCLYDELTKLQVKLDGPTKELLDSSYRDYEPNKPSVANDKLEPHDSVKCTIVPDRSDVVKGYSRCFQLINEFKGNDYRLTDELHENGAVAGYFAFEGQKIFALNSPIKFDEFLSKLQETICDELGSDDALLVGQATGSQYYYVDFIAFDLKALLERVLPLFAIFDIPVYFGTFRSIVPPVSLSVENKA